MATAQLLTPPTAFPLLPTLSRTNSASQQTHTIAQNLGLTQKEAGLLASFKSLLESKQLYTPAYHGQKPSHEDITLLRFLKSCNFNSAQATKSFTFTENWRQTNRVDAVYNEFTKDEFEKSRQYFPQFTGRRDRNGIPVYNFVLSKLDGQAATRFFNAPAKSASSSSTSLSSTSSTEGATNATHSLLEHTFVSAENGVQFVTPLCSQIAESKQQQPISSTTNIVDITGVSLTQFWTLRKNLQVASDMAAKHYPECMEHVFLIGAPSYFPTIAHYCKGWLESSTTRKIHIVAKGQERASLMEYMDEENIPKRYGGKLEWDYGDWPNCDGEMKGVLNRAGYKEWPKGTVRWVNGRVVGQ